MLLPNFLTYGCLIPQLCSPSTVVVSSKASSSKDQAVTSTAHSSSRLASTFGSAFSMTPVSTNLTPSSKLSTVSTGKSASSKVSTASSHLASSSKVSTGTATVSKPISSLTASSRRVSSTSLSSIVQTSTATCPPLKDTTSTTLTYTTQTLAPLSTSYIQNTVGAWAGTSTAVSTAISYSFIYTTVYVTSTLTYATTSFDIVPATATVTVPTAAGFTPVSCLAPYRYGTVTTVTVTSTPFTYALGSTVTSTFDSTLTTYSYSYTSTTTSTLTYTDTVYVSTTQTSVITRASPTSTVYAACASNNIATRHPSGQDFFIPILPNSLTFKFVPAIDPYDCCNQCQADPECVTSSGSYPDREFGPGPGNDPTRFSCALNYKTSQANATCDPTFQIDIGGNDANKLINEQLYISNSGCGQYNIVA